MVRKNKTDTCLPHQGGFSCSLPMLSFSKIKKLLDYLEAGHSQTQSLSEHQEIEERLRTLLHQAWGQIPAKEPALLCTISFTDGHRTPIVHFLHPHWSLPFPMQTSLIDLQHPLLLTPAVALHLSAASTTQTRQNLCSIPTQLKGTLNS